MLYSAEIPPFGAFLPCHPERSRNPNNVRIKRAVRVWDLGKKVRLRLRSAQDDTAGRENIKIYSFLRAIRESPLQLMGLVCILVDRTYFVGVGAHDDPKNNQLLQYIGRTHNVR